MEQFSKIFAPNSRRESQKKRKEQSKLMADAFMVRGWERQQFLEGLYRLIYDIEKDSLENDPDPWIENRVKAYLYLAYLVGQFLVGDLSSALIALPAPNKYESIARDVLTQILEKSKAFARAEEERRYVLAMFMMWLTESAMHPEQVSLMRKEMFNPETIFHAHSATADVKPEGDGLR